MKRVARSGAEITGAMVLVSLMAIGCSERSASVSGVVELDDKPISIEDDQRGMVVFRPVAGGATCTSLINKDGTFRVATGSSSGVAPGDYMVSVRVIELVPKEEGQGAGGKPITPALYADPLTSGLLYSVKSGVNQIEIELDSDAGPAVLPQPVLEIPELTEEGESEASEGEPGAEAKTPAQEEPDASGDDQPASDGEASAEADPAEPEAEAAESTPAEAAEVSDVEK